MLAPHFVLLSDGLHHSEIVVVEQLKIISAFVYYIRAFGLFFFLLFLEPSV